MCLKDGQTMWIEVKKPTGILSELQKVRIKELEAKGFNVKVWTGYGEDFNWKR